MPSFKDYVEQLLMPTLGPGDIVIRDAIAASVPGSCSCHLTPDLNSIEQVSAKLKLQLRKATKLTAEATCLRIDLLLDGVNADECQN